MVENQRQNGEVSYDLVMEDDMAFAEGTFRIGDGEWCVVIVSKRPIESPSPKTCSWDSGVSGVVVHVPQTMRLNAAAIESILSDVYGVAKWATLKGPDSMQLR